MRHPKIRTLIGVVVATAFVAGLAGVGHAGQRRTEEGVVLINEARALAGGVTEGDARGFPVTISQPGSYMLSSNLVVPAGARAIVITGFDVTLDLNGFGIWPVSATGGFGVDGRQATNVTVVNGTVRGMEAGVSVGPNSRVERVQVLSNMGIGIAVGPGSTVTGNIAAGNAGVGISAEAGSIVRHNTVLINRSDGIQASAGSLVTGNIARGNGGYGLALEVGVAYTHNVLLGNESGAVLWGTSLTQNLCPGAPC